MDRTGAGDARQRTRLGERLAIQHRVARDRFGRDRDNTIGSTPLNLFGGAYLRQALGTIQRLLAEVSH